MANPVIDSIVFDKSSYAIGSTMTATVTYHSLNTHNVAGTFTASVTDQTSAEVGTGVVTFNVAMVDLLNCTGRDATNRVWTVKSDDHVGVAVLTATA